MKWLSVFAMLPAIAVAFQHVVPIHHKTSLTHEETLDRAEQCAILHDFCNIDELEMLADDLQQFQSSLMMHVVQGNDHKVYEILRKQSELMRLMDTYTASSRPEDDVFEDYLLYHW